MTLKGNAWGYPFPADLAVGECPTCESSSMHMDAEHWISPIKFERWAVCEDCGDSFNDTFELRSRERCPRKEEVMSKERLAAIKKRCDESTPGPWIVGKHPKVVTAPCPCCGDICECEQYGPGEEAGNYNSDFIAHSREDVPWLIEEIERLRKAVRVRGGCRMLSEGDKCDCGLCKRDAEINNLANQLKEADEHVVELDTECRKLRALLDRLVFQCQSSLEGTVGALLKRMDRNTEG